MSLDLIFINAVRANNTEQVRKLLQEGADANYCDDIIRITPLHFAAINNCLGVVPLLVAAGANLNARTIEGETPLDIAKNQPERTHGRMVDLLKFFILNKLDTNNMY
ncbi:MAG: ankyrin repeat domain-containing protein [Gammaproteobacteria bacterium]